MPMQIKSLEIEKAFIQKNLDNVLELATEQNASYKEKYEEVTCRCILEYFCVTWYIWMWEQHNKN